MSGRDVVGRRPFHPALSQWLRRLLRHTGLRVPGAEQYLFATLNRRIATAPLPAVDYRFLFISGAEGSGTTMLTRILSRLPGAVCLGGKYSTVDPANETARLQAKYFNKAITRLWDRRAPVALAERARRALPHTIAALREQPAYRATDLILYKRSAPFNPGDRFRPDLADIYTIWPAGRILLIYRDPRAAAVSAWRRGYAPTLRAAAIVCEEQLSYLNAQLTTLPPPMWHILPYDVFCQMPNAFVEPLATFTGRSPADVIAAINAEDIRTTPLTHWQTNLSPARRAFLDAHFDDRRLRQWALLTASAEGVANA